MGFKITNSSRKKLELIEPTKIISWVIHFFSEIAGTLIISFLFAGLFIIVPNGHILLDYLYSNIIIALYSGFLVIGILLIFFIRWSADANPIISIYKVITGQETYRYCAFKMFAQLIGAFIAGLLVMWCTQSTLGTAWNAFIPPTPSLQHGFFKPHIFSTLQGFMFPIGVELIVGTMLLWAIFSTSITNKYKILTVLFITCLATFFGCAAGMMNFNAARALTQDVGAIINNQMTGQMWITFSAMVIGNLITPFLLVILQWLFSKHINVWFLKIINYKKIK